MWRTFKNDWALFAGILMLVAAGSLLTTLLSVRGAAIAFTSTEIGLIQAAYPLGALAGSSYAPKLVERVGHIRSFGALASLCSTAAVVHLLTNDPWVWGSMRFLAGLCFPGLFVIAESWLNAKAENRSRAALLSIYFVTQTVGTVIGQGLAGLHDSTGTKLFGLTSILISLCLIPLLVSRSPAPEFTASERMPLRRFLKISPMAILGALLAGASQTAFYVALPLYGLRLGMDSAETTTLLMAGAAAGAAAQFPVGWISDHTDRRFVVIGASVLAVLVCLGGLAGGPRSVVYAEIALIAAATLPMYSICVAHANDQMTAAQRVPGSGTLVFCYYLGGLFGAFAGPAAIGQMGARGFLLLLALFGAVLAGVAAVRQRQTPPPADTGKAHPVAVHAQAVGVIGPDMPGEAETAA
ncbi:MAG: MFS transporter [Rhodospirillaceae bacterium]